MQRFKALRTVLRLGSFTKAAHALGYTQSSISQMMASLEEELSFKLLIRSRNGITLTQEGQQLYPFLEQVLHSYEAMEEKAREIRGLETGVIRVGTISSITCRWMPPLIKGFKARYPNVKFTFQQGDYRLIPEWIELGIIDFGFVSPDSCPHLMTIPVKDGELLAVLPRRHRWAKEKAIPLEGLLSDPFILLEEGNYSEPMEAFQKKGIKPHVAYRLHDDYAVMTMVEAGLGVSILAKLMTDRNPYDIVTVPIDPPLYRHLAICYKDWDLLPLASKHFITYIKEKADELP